MLWSMYWLNYLDRNAIALARLNDLEEDLNLSSTGQAYIFSILDFILIILLDRVPNLRINSFRRLYSRPSAIKLVSHSNSP